LNERALAFSSVLEKITGVQAVDVVEHGETLIFVVKPESMGKAIGQAGRGVSMLQKKLNLKVAVVASMRTPTDFVKAYFGEDIEKVELSECGKKVTILSRPECISRVVGRNGEKINILRVLLKKYFDVETVKVLQ
jgi:N utilization substance protein A